MYVLGFVIMSTNLIRAGKDYLPFIQLGRTPGVDSVELARRLDGVSRRNAIPLGLPFGHAVHKRAYVCNNVLYIKSD